MPELNLTSRPGGGASESEIHGPLKYIVRSAHRWGGNGTVPDFNKIRAVLTTKHPEVIAKAFGGDPNRAAAWIKDAWEKYYGRMLKGKGGTGPTYWRGKGKGGSTESDATMSLNPFGDDEEELFLADGEEPAQDAGNGELWYPVCRTGSWQRSPMPGGKPLEITLDRLRTWKDSFDEGAWENVTLPLTHKDQTHENTGFVTGLDIRPDPKRQGGWKLWAKHKFTEPDILEKVRRGTIRGRSVGVAVAGLRRTSDGRFFPEVLKHVCLTNHPWLDGLNDGEPGLAASWKPEDFYLDADGDDDSTGEKHAFRGPKGSKCKICGKSYASGNHYGSEDMAAAEDELEMDALDHAVSLLLGTPRDPDAEQDASGEPDDDADDQDTSPKVIGHVLAAKTIGEAVAGEYVIPHALIQKDAGAGDADVKAQDMRAARDADGSDAEDASDNDLPDMPPGVHHVEGTHPSMRKHKLLTEVATGKQRGLPDKSMVTPFVPYITNASSPDTGMGLAADDGKHRFAGPKGAKCKVCGKSYANGNHYGAEDMGAAYDPGPPVLRLRLDTTRAPTRELHAALRRRGLVK